MKIFILSHDLSSNCLGRAAVFAHLLRDDHHVEIVGPAFGADVWYPFRKPGVPVRKVEGEIFWPHHTEVVQRLLDKIRCDLMIAIKPRPTSYGIALMKRAIRRIPILLDIDDWEMAFYADRDWRSWPTDTLLRRPNSPLHTQLLEAAIPQADAISVASHKLRNRFGGTIIPHARDATLFDPSRYDGPALKEQYGLGAFRLLVFVGTPRPHKGLEDLYELLKDLPEDVHLLIVGATNAPDAYEEELRDQGGPRVHLLKAQGLERIPAHLAMADLIVVPQDESRVSKHQLPAKLIDAMAMARPIVASSIGDIPRILSDGAGRTFPPGDQAALSQAVREVLDSPDQARRMGQRARERFLQKYSLDAVRPRLAKLLAGIEPRTKTSH